MYGQIRKPIWINEDWCAAEKKSKIELLASYCASLHNKKNKKKTISESVKRIVINNSAHMGQNNNNKNVAVSWG